MKKPTACIVILVYKLYFEVISIDLQLIGFISSKLFKKRPNDPMAFIWYFQTTFPRQKKGKERK